MDLVISERASRGKENAKETRNYIGPLILAILLGALISFSIIPFFTPFSASGHAGCVYTEVQGFPLGFQYAHGIESSPNVCSIAYSTSYVGAGLDQIFWTGLLFLALTRIWK
jgi:hypothetical protein